MVNKQDFWQWLLDYSLPCMREWLKIKCYDNNQNFEPNHIREWTVDHPEYHFTSIMLHNKQMLELNTAYLKEAGAPAFKYYADEEGNYEGTNMYHQQIIIDYKIWKDSNTIEVVKSGRGMKIHYVKEYYYNSNGDKDYRWVETWKHYRFKKRLRFTKNNAYFIKGKSIYTAKASTILDFLTLDWLHSTTAERARLHGLPYSEKEHEYMLPIGMGVLKTAENLFAQSLYGVPTMELLRSLPWSMKTIIEKGIDTPVKAYQYIDRSFQKGGELEELIEGYGFLGDCDYEICNNIYSMHILFHRFHKKDLVQVLKDFYELYKNPPYMRTNWNMKWAYTKMECAYLPIQEINPFVFSDSQVRNMFSDYKNCQIPSGYYIHYDTENLHLESKQVLGPRHGMKYRKIRLGQTLDMKDKDVFGFGRAMSINTFSFNTQSSHINVYSPGGDTPF